MRYLDDLATSVRPAILVGGGAYAARAAIEAFATAHAIPCFRTWNALDVITDESPVYCGTVGTYGGPGRNYGIQNCDLLLCLGSRISGRITGGMPESFARGAKKYIVDVDPGLLDTRWQQVKGDVNVLASCEEFIEGMPAPTHNNLPQHGAWLYRCREWLARYDPVTPERSGIAHHYGFVRQLSLSLPENAIVTYDTGGNAIMMGHCFRSKRGQRIFSSHGNSPMGGALCYAIGAAFAEPERPVYCLIGDGGMSMNVQELQTLKYYNPDVRVIVLQNYLLGNTAAYQRVNGLKPIGCGPDGYSSPDYHLVAEAYKIKNFFGVAWAWDDILYRRGPWVWEVDHADFCDYAPRMVRWDRAVEEMEPDLPLDEHLSNMSIPSWSRK
jgi:acetolactate synthase-1/2/3 large subunit